MTFPANNTQHKLIDIVRYMESNGLMIIIFGGWSAELLDIEKSRPHSDIDLLMIDETFDNLTKLIAHNKWDIVKSYSHKKAFIVDGVMIEVFLVKSIDGEYITEFIGKKMSMSFNWPSKLFIKKIIKGRNFKLATKETMNNYKKSHKKIHSNSPWK